MDALRLPPPPSPLDPTKQKSSLSLSEAPPRGLPVRRGRQPSPELRHATSDDNLSSSTGEGPGLQVTWTRPRYRQVATKNQTPRDVDFEARRKKRRSRSFEVTGQAVSITASQDYFHILLLYFLLSWEFVQIINKKLLVPSLSWCLIICFHTSLSSSLLDCRLVLETFVSHSFSFLSLAAATNQDNHGSEVPPSGQHIGPPPPQ